MQLLRSNSVITHRDNNGLLNGALSFTTVGAVYDRAVIDRAYSWAVPSFATISSSLL
jgi:hypothetical protein